jgi:mRNA interferase MazF
LAKAKASYCPDANDIVWLNFDPQAGSEQRGRRPALVLSPREYNERAKLCIVAPITSQSKGYPFEVMLPAGGKTSGVVLSDHLKSLSWDAHDAAYIESANFDVSAEVRAKVKALLLLQ